MKHYHLIIYWWEGLSHEHRTSGGEYRFESPDDDSATQFALAHFDEQIELADQAVVVDELGRVVWQTS
jgi:hypothetical protein